MSGRADNNIPCKLIRRQAVILCQRMFRSTDTGNRSRTEFSECQRGLFSALLLWRTPYGSSDPPPFPEARERGSCGWRGEDAGILRQVFPAQWEAFAVPYDCGSRYRREGTLHGFQGGFLRNRRFSGSVPRLAETVFPLW